jgi:recombination protein RecT
MMSTTIAKRTNSNGNGTLTGFSALLESRKESIRAVLPKHLTPERLIKLASMALTKTPKLQECTPLSLFTSVMKSAELGLDCSGTLGSAYLVPFKRKFKDAGGRWKEEYECTLIVGYRGLIDLARRSNQIQSIEARVVYQNDEFQCDFGTEGKLVHRPQLDADPGDFRLVYAVAHLMGGGIQVEVMVRTAVDKIRNSSKGYYAANPSGPWHDHYEEMARKTVIRRLCKYLPMSVELESALSAEDDDVVTAGVPMATAPKMDANAALALETQQPDHEYDQTDAIDQGTAAHPSSETSPAGESQPSSAGDAKERGDESGTDANQNSGDESGPLALADFQKMTWDEADKLMHSRAKDMGITVKTYYAAKFKIFGSHPQAAAVEQWFELFQAIIGGKIDKTSGAIVG